MICNHHTDSDSVRLMLICNHHTDSDSVILMVNCNMVWSITMIVSSWITMSRQPHWLPRDESLDQNSFTLVTSGRITRWKLVYTGYLGTNHSFTLVTSGRITHLHWLPRDESLVQNCFTLVTSERITRSNYFTLITSGRITRSIYFTLVTSGRITRSNSLTLVTSGRFTRSKLFYTGYLGANHSFKTLLRWLPRDESLVQNTFTLVISGRITRLHWLSRDESLVQNYLHWFKIHVTKWQVCLVHC